jgi:hypothetical protein
LVSVFNWNQILFFGAGRVCGVLIVRINEIKICISLGEECLRKTEEFVKH